MGLVPVLGVASLVLLAAQLVVKDSLQLLLRLRLTALVLPLLAWWKGRAEAIVSAIIRFKLVVLFE